MNSAYKLNKQGDKSYAALMYSFPSFEPVDCFMSILTCFLMYIQVSQEAGKVDWYSYLFKNFPQFVVIHTVKGFSVGQEAEIDVFLEFLCFLYDPTNVGNLISGSSAFSKPCLYIWKFWVHIMPKPSMKDFEHNLASMWNEHNCMVVWISVLHALLWNWTEHWPLPVLWTLLSFPIGWPTECSTLIVSSLGFEIAQLEFHLLY